MTSTYDTEAVRERTQAREESYALGRTTLINALRANPEPVPEDFEAIEVAAGLDSSDVYGILGNLVDEGIVAYRGLRYEVQPAETA